MTWLLIVIGLLKGLPGAIVFPDMATCEANRELIIDSYKEIIGPFPPVHVHGKCVEAKKAPAPVIPAPAPPPAIPKPEPTPTP